VAPDGGSSVARGFSHKGITLLSGANPGLRADRAAEAADLSEGTLCLCPSPLYGHGLDRLLARAEAVPGCAVLCVEAEPELLALARSHLGEALARSPRLALAEGASAGEVCALARRKWGDIPFRRATTARLNGGWRLHESLYAELEKALREEIALDWGNALTLAKLGRRYMRNALRNLALTPLCPSLGELSFGDAPALVLGAGPSLDGALNALAGKFGKSLEARGERPFRMVCADTCLPALKARGITPDLAVVLESQHWNLQDFVGLSGWEAPAAMDLSALPRSGDVLGGDLRLFFTPWTRLRVFDRLAASGLLPAALPPLGSVGLTAAAIALRLTRGAVVATGLDFSFTLDLFHARSSPGHSTALRRQSRIARPSCAGAAFAAGSLPATAKDGGRVFSTPALRGYRDLFERKFALGSSAGRFFDIEGGGLPLGLRTLSRAQAFDLLSAGAPLCSASPPPRASEARPAAVAESLARFAAAETERLARLRDMLAGGSRPDCEALGALIDECDYLWAHFPDRAAGRPRPTAAELEAGSSATVSFLKRLRVEIDPFAALLRRLENGNLP